MSNEKIQTPFICPLSFSLCDRNGHEQRAGSARTEIEKEHLTLHTDAGPALRYSLRDLVDIEDKEYKLLLSWAKGETLLLSRLGFKFEDFYRILNKTFQELWLKDMLVYEKIRQTDLPGEYSFYNNKEENIAAGKCEVRLYETSLAILPLKGNIIRIHLGNINHLEKGDYSLSVLTDNKEKIIFAKMGSGLDVFRKALTTTINNLSQKTQAFLQELLPNLDSPIISEIALLLKEGKLARRKDIDAISPNAWPEMEKKIVGSPLGEEYLFLKSVGQAENIAVGFKRGLMGGFKNDYFWFLVPIFGNKSANGGNAAILEAGMIETPADTDEEQSDMTTDIQEDEQGVLKQEGKATYCFRIMDRGQYAATDTALMDTLLNDIWHGFVTSFNACMQEVNFRREPIYLTDDKLTEGAFIKYLHSFRRLPELRRLRELFIGRIMHQSQQQWENDINDLLKFNTQCRDNLAKWKKGE